MRDTSAISSRIAILEKAIQDAQPVALPAGSQAQVIAVSRTAYPPILIVELRIVAHNGHPVPGMATKDFEVVEGDKVSPPIAAIQANPQATPVQVLFALDHSNSTAGTALQEAKAGAAALLVGLQGTANVKLTAFSSTIRQLSDWSTRPADLAANLKPLKADGPTALLLVLSQAAQEVSTRDGAKAICLFTDGKDTVGGPEWQETLSRCQKAAIAIHVVALQTRDLDREFLSTITIHTRATVSWSKRAIARLASVSWAGPTR